MVVCQGYSKFRTITAAIAAAHMAMDLGPGSNGRMHTLRQLVRMHAADIAADRR
jgi:hypothetical protein